MPTAANLYYYTNGDEAHGRAPVVLIHGAGGHHLYWPPQIRRITGHRIFAVDLPGHGRSDGIGRHRIEDYVDDILGFMAAVGINAAVWIGHSMGGAIALQAALQNPRRVLGLVLIGSGARLRVDPKLLEYATRETSFPAALQLLGERSFSEASDPRLRQLALQRMAEMRPGVLQGDLLACAAFDASDRLSDVHVSSLILLGEHDQLVHPRNSEMLREGLRDSELRVIRGAGHMVMLERAEETAAALRQFLDAITYVPGLPVT
jgi:pimeloyl-ACP methyl ester carboxylesterase